MDEVIEWTDRRIMDGGVVEQGFCLTREVGVVPGVLWLSPSPVTSPPPLVLLGHGGSGHKKSERIGSLARWFASHAGLAALAIDGPYHGDRVPGPIPTAEYQARIAEEGIDVVLDRMADDWQATVDALGALGIADTDHLAYLGMSMGTRFGVPLAAGLGDELRCVVFGKFGLRQGPALHKGLEAPKRTATEARRITAPALFHLQWHDEIFPRDGQLALFDALGSQDKRLVSYAGPHAETEPAAIALWRDFVSRHLASHVSR
ncbi:dienelactone hydrolase family protein [Streptomyces sp. DG2A-72]|uniref:dienelactone hydrolase family protein n=1 Tax=Streptomyces sp. DG2A-72 TaxID=3051386 RepID=UPI00265C3401|nr:dienelactone hydrolase family protein [Streptomyces sp. DG2A-72]MDO0930326.1 dienelactone hydrolase family protein [Streptomyces sp. DG2A-72]